MTIIKTTALTGAALDWAVAQAAGVSVDICTMPEAVHILRNPLGSGRWRPSADWSQGGPIIEREGLNVQVNLAQGGWHAMRARPTPGRIKGFSGRFGATPLIAAMRCYVASKLGDSVDVPDSLSTRATA
ncbi:phage protein NinX family protein [Achromobacter sp. NFACC18-2]|uniref:phage protein NinX family protein n=1 Tax=Achromobacter sp. NFACC18-2 TaxID=1564112 RepID=UPI0008B6BA4D|nr:phage protein NinX family protein [Achromobacter sp. NFACC18-2]SEJ85457.1 Protein of unknown function [Achromobacter sp. NFACC18-2]